jgi:hypothetical protein
VRAVIADDSLLLREGITRLLAEGGIEVAACVGDAEALLAAVAKQQPDLAIIDVRMPPAYQDEGLRAASSCPSSSRSATRPSCSQATPGQSATCSKTASPTLTSSSKRPVASPRAEPPWTPRSSGSSWPAAGRQTRSPG